MRIESTHFSKEPGINQQRMKTSTKTLAIFSVALLSHPGGPGLVAAASSASALAVEDWKENKEVSLQFVEPITFFHEADHPSNHLTYSLSLSL
jgi:hypothetical protein